MIIRQNLISFLCGFAPPHGFCELTSHIPRPRLWLQLDIWMDNDVYHLFLILLVEGIGGVSG